MLAPLSLESSRTACFLTTQFSKFRPVTLAPLSSRVVMIGRRVSSVPSVEGVHSALGAIMGISSVSGSAPRLRRYSTVLSCKFRAAASSIVASKPVAQLTPVDSSSSRFRTSVRPIAHAVVRAAGRRRANKSFQTLVAEQLQDVYGPSLDGGFEQGQSLALHGVPALNAERRTESKRP